MKYPTSHMEETEKELFILINSRGTKQSEQKSKHDRIRLIPVLPSFHLEILLKDQLVLLLWCLYKMMLHNKSIKLTKIVPILSIQVNIILPINEQHDAKSLQVLINMSVFPSLYMTTQNQLRVRIPSFMITLQTRDNLKTKYKTLKTLFYLESSHKLLYHLCHPILQLCQIHQIVPFVNNKTLCQLVHFNQPSFCSLYSLAVVQQK